MMRSLYSGVSGLKVHQTKMDVIGHNISNVNTIGFKAGQVNFSDILYQTTANASGPNAQANTAGTNARQIGLGASVASITNTVTLSGGTQRTDNALDLMIEGEQLFIVNNGIQNYFTKAGAFTIDAAGVLCNNGGCKVMGWQVDPQNPDRCIKDTVSELRVKSPENSYTEPEATTDVYFTGNFDYKDAQFQSDEGKTTTISFYDKTGQNYMALLSVKSVDTTDDNGDYTVSVTDILDSSGESIFRKYNETTKKYEPNPNINSIRFGTADTDTFSATVDPDTGDVTLTGTRVPLQFDSSTGQFAIVGTDTNKPKSVGFEILDNSGNSPFSKIDCDFSNLTMYASSGSSSLASQRGNAENGTGTGKPKGSMTGISVDTSGRIYGSYDNGDKRLLCQIAVARFSNPAGLEAVGNSLFVDTLNSEKFNGIGEEITQSGGKISSGVLEMSNVDLSTEFTSIITTQRGFQANSRVITTSDTMLEELINLKR